MSKVIPNDSTFISAMLGVRVPQQKLARYYLNSLQRQKDGIQQPQYVPNLGDEITLEHILPENPTGDAWKHFTVEERQQYTNRLGNLALLTATANSSIGNVGYNKKEATLKSSDFSLTSMAAGQGKWTTTQIENRQAELSQLAAKTWPL
ncbi:MAG TPA: hypothetical protein DEA22_02180 [Blastocatellia bacterium]|nr:hypothetical protein [Blastocatellia bacterium]